MSLLKRLFGAGSSVPAPVPFDAPVAPEAPFYAIGDVHGCFSQMQTLLDKIATQRSDETVVFVGDYIDRGEQSAEVLCALLARRDDPGLICLRGNHEDMMLDFLADPGAKGGHWLRYGGLQTLSSFGVSPSSTGQTLFDAAAALTAAMGTEMLDWLRTLPVMWQSGNVAVVHAGADPATPIRLQAERTLTWGHPDFEKVPRQDGTWVLHGHTIVDAPQMTGGRIAVDTGAYATGRLTAAHVMPGAVTFLNNQDKI